ncbi:MAG TPA: hypothetical protein VGN32_07515 [Ktedonobacterales bacterium]|jgi:hypothetical protein|nr:hypothetical protein [Ktedonobacterales bacterium]
MSDLSWHLAVKSLLDAESPEEWGRIVTAQRGELLTSSSLRSFERALHDAQREGNPIAVPMQVVYAFLRMANEKGISASVAQEKQRREAIIHAGATLLSAAVWDATAVLRQFQSTLLDPDAIRMIGRLAAVAAREHPSDPLADVRQKISTLKLALLDDARVNGIDAAERRYNTAMTALIQEAQEG